MTTIALSKANVYAYCRDREYLEPTVVEMFRHQLAPDEAVALSVAIEPFVPSTCPSCRAEGYFRFHFLASSITPTAVTRGT